MCRTAVYVNGSRVGPALERPFLLGESLLAERRCVSKQAIAAASACQAARLAGAQPGTADLRAAGQAFGLPSDVPVLDCLGEVQLAAQELRAAERAAKQRGLEGEEAAEAVKRHMVQLGMER